MFKLTYLLLICYYTRYIMTMVIREGISYRPRSRENGMKRTLLVFALMIAVSSGLMGSDESFAGFTFGLPRDWCCCNQCISAPCEFPMALNPCAVPCRPPEYQEQAVPCAVETACPSVQLPCHGVSYGNNPYPLFRVR
jgi:hypothetical protein